MNSLLFLKNMNVEGFSNAWRSNLSCEGCSNRLHFLRKKKICYFCKNPFCHVCIMRREDKKFCCRKCQVLTARPLDRRELLNLKSRDLVNYLTSRQISTNGCVEKEDLVNVLMRAVNNSCFHSSSNPLAGSSCTNSYPNSPRNHSYSTGQSKLKRRLSHSVENLFNEDGIRIIGNNIAEDDCGYQSGSIDPDNGSVQQMNEAGQSSQLPVEDSISSPNERIEEESVTPEEPTSTQDNALKSVDQNNKNIPLNKPLLLSDIKSSSDLDALSVRQLKQLLLRNKTDYKGCIERAELLQKANRLWSDYIVSRKDLDKLNFEELCKICMDAPIECVLLECGHMATCTSCGRQLCECPICRQFVVRCVRTFKA